MQGERWILCPNCKGKTRIRVLPETKLQQFPLFCPKCKNEYLVNIEKGEITASTQIKN